MPSIPVNKISASQPDAPAKAIIKNLDSKDPVDTVECMFRPKEYTFSKNNQWSQTLVIGNNVPELNFGGGSGMTLTMDLFFDTYEKGTDVRKHTDKIWKLMMINPDRVVNHKGLPPRCEFSWGETWSFQAVITDISQTFTLFLQKGTPVRSTMKVTFKQAAEEGKYPGQNPTTMSVPGYKTRRVKQSETLDWIAYDEYGDSSQWRFLADANGIEDPLRLEVGHVLAIPPKP
jgi:hypothetical protein